MKKQNKKLVFLKAVVTVAAALVFLMLGPTIGAIQGESKVSNDVNHQIDFTLGTRIKDDIGGFSFAK